MNNQLASGLLILIVAMAVAMALIPLLIRFAPALGMMDAPDARKVHAVPIPRVGGVGIVLGALLAMLLGLPIDDLTISYLLGSLVLLVFGVWDDVKELGHYVKFIGQFVAVLLVVYHGELYVSHLPLLGLDPVNEMVGKIFTVFAMVGVINAINHSDGLDGLAGGESLLSLGAMVYLASQASDPVVSTIGLATIGGVFGFLRFNTHPARVFMGDGGSQFLGFTLAFMVVYLTQVANPALSPALPALLVGLPVVDILSVLVQRVRGGMNWFRATKNHIHHRLLELDFRHYESVILIYSVQALLVISGVMMPYESDMLILGFYMLVTAFVFSSLTVAERQGWKAHRGGREAGSSWLMGALSPDGILVRADMRLIQALLVLFLLAGAMAVSQVPGDLTIAAVMLFMFLGTRLWLGFRVWFLYLRLILFVAVAVNAYLLEYYPPTEWGMFEMVYHAFYFVLGGAVVIAVRFSEKEFFQVSPLDYLFLLIVTVLAFISEMGGVEARMIKLVVQLIVLFYGVEVIIRHMTSRVNTFTGASLAALGIVALRGLL